MSGIDYLREGDTVVTRKGVGVIKHIIYHWNRIDITYIEIKYNDGNLTNYTSETLPYMHIGKATPMLVAKAKMKV